MNVLIVAAHPDDDVLGCGGAMDFWAAEGHFVHVHFAVDGETSRGSGCESDRGQIESRNAAAHSVCKILGCKFYISIFNGISIQFIFCCRTKRIITGLHPIFWILL